MEFIGLEENGLPLGNPIPREGYSVYNPGWRPHEEHSSEERPKPGERKPSTNMPRGRGLELIMTSVIEGPQLQSVPRVHIDKIPLCSLSLISLRSPETH